MQYNPECKPYYLVTELIANQFFGFDPTKQNFKIAEFHTIAESTEIQPT